MTSKVDQFLSESGGNNFTETASRPAPQGEETDVNSNGGLSTHSSASHKSQLSHTSGRSIGSSKGDINPATPRKSNIDRTSATMPCQVQGFVDDDMDAPLGFEPEGSVANSPPFTENSTPPYIKWAESLHTLLDDRDGVQLFKSFLDQERIGTYSVDFWYACEGLKQKEEAESQIIQIIKVIHKKYIKSDKLPYVDIATKKHISDSILRNIDINIFNTAQSEVVEYMKNNTYPLFLKSDLYVQYVNRGGESPKSSNTSSGSNSARPMSSGPLPTVREDQELQQDDFAVPFSVYGPSSSKYSSRTHSDSKRHEAYSASYGGYVSSRAVPYHLSYAPVSAQDSEIQSLSSQDALTDDTRSLTDSSVDGHSYRDSRKHKKYMKVMKQRAGQNRDPGFIPVIPRTDHAPKDRNIAEVDPKKFAALLIAELEKVVREQENKERVQLSLKVMTQSDISDTVVDKSCASSMSASRNTTATSLVPLLVPSSVIDEENADSILEEHCSRIWDRSAGQTPSRSPGRSRSPDRIRKSLSQTQAHSGTSSMPGTLHSTKPLHSKKRTDFYSMSSFDSGMGEDSNKCSVETHKHIHHHHHHHHDRGRKSKHRLELQAQQRSLVYWSGGSGTGGSGTGSGTGARQKPASSRSHSDACSNLDSGISMIESHPDVVPTDPSTTKVLQWIMDNENLNRGTATAYTDSDKTNSTYKRSHKSSALAPVSSQPYKQSGSKKGVNRSASADSCSRVTWVPQGGGAMGVLPSQPICQDTSMPLMPPPNTTVQLEEVNRRLEADHGAKASPVKSKSFTGVPGKDKRPPPMPMSQSSNQVRAPSLPASRTAPSDLDAGGDNKTDKRTSKRSSGSGNTSTSSKPEETVIGYYMCGEPIPYRITVQQPSVTLGQLKQLISKRGNFKYFFKTHNKDFDSEVVYEEIKEDHRILPVFDGKVVVKIDKIEDMDTSNTSSKSNTSKKL